MPDFDAETKRVAHLVKRRGNIIGLGVRVR